MPVSLELGDSSVQHIDQRILVSTPIMNSGLDGASRVVVDSMQLLLADGVLLGNSSQLSFPRVFTPFPAGKVAGIATRFQDTHPQTGAPINQLGPPQVRITGTIDGNLPFTFMRVVDIPPSTPIEGTPFFAEVAVGANAGVFQYLVVNTSAATSPHKIAALALDIVRPCTVTGTPPGWRVDTDGSTYVLWSAPPEVSSAQIGGGASLRGFEITSNTSAFEGNAFVLSTWDFSASAPGPMLSDMIITPAR